MLYFNSEDIDSGELNRAQRAQFTHNAELQQHSEDDFSVIAQNSGHDTLADAYREIDNITVAIMQPVGQFATLHRLNAVSRSVGLGKLEYEYRKASEQEGGTVSLMGQNGIIADKGEYLKAGTVIPIIDHGTSREWRDMLSSSADGFDVVVDDAREAELVLLRTAKKYLWLGDNTIKGPNGRVWLGIKADPSLVQETTTVDMASAATTPQEIVDEFTRLRDILRITNNCSEDLEVGVSREMISYWEKIPYSLNDKGFGTVLSYIEGLRGIKSVYEDPELTGGKELLFAFFSQQGFHAVTGQALSTYMDERVKKRDPFTLIKWMAQGYLAKSDFKGQKTALYCKSA